MLSLFYDTIRIYNRISCYTGVNLHTGFDSQLICFCLVYFIFVGLNSGKSYIISDIYLIFDSKFEKWTIWNSEDTISTRNFCWFWIYNLFLSCLNFEQVMTTTKKNQIAPYFIEWITYLKKTQNCFHFFFNYFMKYYLKPQNSIHFNNQLIKIYRMIWLLRFENCQKNWNFTFFSKITIFLKLEENPRKRLSLEKKPLILILQTDSGPARTRALQIITIKTFYWSFWAI